MPNFFDRYILQTEEDLSLSESLENTKDVFRVLKEDLVKFQDFRYQPDKWTPKDILQHVIDNERIMAYRALSLARGESQRLIGYDENEYAKNFSTFNRTVESLLEEFDSVRNSSITLFNSFDEKMFKREGVCFETKITPLALGFVIVGHANHHLKVFKERYVKNSF